MTARRNGPKTPLGAWIASMLRSRRWTQTDLAERMGVDQSMISKWVRGARNPDIPRCESIARAFGVPPEEVLSLAGRMPARVRTGSSHPTRDKLHALIDTMDPEALEPFLEILERHHELLAGSEVGRG